MSEVNIQNMVAAIAATDLLVPLEIVQAAQQLERWFTEQNITEWELGDCASRITVLHLRKSLSNLYKKYWKVIDMARNWANFELAEEELEEAGINVRHELYVRRNDGKAILETAGEQT